MANWCSNYLTIDGPDKKKVFDLFKRLEAKYRKTGTGQTLKYFKDDTYLFDIYIDDDFISFETKWGPPESSIYAIFRKYNITGELSYSEPGNCVYGEIRKNELGEIDERHLTHFDFAQCDYIEDRDIYIFEGEEYESDAEILETLLERKW